MQALHQSVLFKKFADVDCFDLELDTSDPQRFIDAVAMLGPTFGGINLEDIKAPECFVIEEQLRERMNIPVFHDDQHGTAIVVSAAIRNGLRLAGKKPADIKLVCSGAGAAALACLNLLCEFGVQLENIHVLDIEGVVYKGREVLMDEYKARYAHETDARTLDDVIAGADANPVPEISPEAVMAVRDDAIMATGRSDYPNQVNNVLCFPFLFRGALDVGATEINIAMQLACVDAIADIARREASDVVRDAYGGEPLRFGKDYLIPKPFDPRLMTEVPMRVARAAIESGAATRPIADFDAYERKLEEFVIRSGLIMKPVFDRAREHKQRVLIAEGESTRVLNAVQVLVDDEICTPIIMGRTETIKTKIADMGLRLEIGQGFEVFDPTNNPDFDRHVTLYLELMERSGVSPEYAQNVIRTRSTALGALMLRHGEVDALVCGAQGAYARHLRYLCDIVGLRHDVMDCSALMMMIQDKGTYFLTDTHVTVDPSIDEVIQTTEMAMEVVRRFGMEPKIGLLSHSNFGSRNNDSAVKMREARAALKEKYPDLAVEGEMHADAALDEYTRERIFPNATYKGGANLLVMPNLDSANIAYNMIKVVGDGVTVGPMLMGMARPAHVVTESITVRGIVNMCAIAAVDAIDARGRSVSELGKRRANLIV